MTDNLCINQGYLCWKERGALRAVQIPIGCDRLRELPGMIVTLPLLSRHPRFLSLLFEGFFVVRACRTDRL